MATSNIQANPLKYRRVNTNTIPSGINEVLIRIICVNGSNYINHFVTLPEEYTNGYMIIQYGDKDRYWGNILINQSVISFSANYESTDITSASQMYLYVR